MKICSVEQMRAMDRAAIETYRIPEQVLMENAGLATYAVLRRHLPVENRCFAVFCGTGNNGGDGLVIARKLFADGADVRVMVVGDPDRFKGAARVNHDMLVALKVPVTGLDDNRATRAAADLLARCDAVVDAILGTGLDREVRRLHRQVIEAVNAAGRPVISVDIPSGINGDTGRVLGAAVQADWTVTYGLPKLGNLLHPGCRHGGRLYVSRISFPPELTRRADLTCRVNRPIALPPRAPDGHKGSFGRALFVAGAAGYLGAPYLAAFAFLRAGGGYSRLAAPQPICSAIAGRGVELVLVPQAPTAAGSIAGENLEALLDLGHRMDIVVAGPGMSLDPETQALVRVFTRRLRRPLLLDGDGLTAVAGHPDILNAREAPTVLTPHPGEMARLADVTVAEVEADRIGVLQRTAAALKAIIVLKGAHSLVGTPDGQVYVNLSGNSGMATAGSGDVLAGAIAAMHGLGLPLPGAVCQGVLLHGLAGDVAAAEMGPDGMTARDVLDRLPAATAMLRGGLPEAYRNRYAGAEVIL